MGGTVGVEQAPRSVEPAGAVRRADGELAADVPALPDTFALSGAEHTLLLLLTRLVPEGPDPLAAVVDQAPGRAAACAGPPVRHIAAVAIWMAAHYLATKRWRGTAQRGAAGTDRPAALRAAEARRRQSGGRSHQADDQATPASAAPPHRRPYRCSRETIHIEKNCEPPP